MYAINATDYEDKKLKEWRDEYIKNPIYKKVMISFMGYKELSGSIVDGYIMGVCQSTHTAESYDWVQSRIYLDLGCKKMPKLFRDAVLWHEFCHAWTVAEESDGSGHRMNFRNRRRENTVYWLCDILLKLIGWIWVR